MDLVSVDKQNQSYMITNFASILAESSMEPMTSTAPSNDLSSFKIS